MKHHPVSMFPTKRKGAQVVGSHPIINSPSAAQTEEIGQVIGRRLHGGEIVLLTGSLGAGKSVFARGVASALGVTRWRGSPTFALVHEYSSTPALIHIDLYRLAEEEIEDLGLEEYASPANVLVVEWADRAPEYLRALPSSRLIAVHLEHGPGDERMVTVEEENARPAGDSGC
jgi:tRNA threonylcarbamoyladenosine biosynthesis protein TsaE